MKVNSCSICDELNGIYENIENEFYSKIISSKRNILLNTTNFVVIPSLGALNKTHVLIVPKKHTTSFSRLSEDLDSEIEKIKEILSTHTKNKIDKNLVFFEHGTGKYCDSSGSCISHAHLHAICELNKFTDLMKRKLNFININEYTYLHSKADKYSGYIYYQDENNFNWIINNPLVPSQFFRKEYSKISNSKINWNWRESVNIDIINNVIDFYDGLSF